MVWRSQSPTNQSESFYQQDNPEPHTSYYGSNPDLIPIKNCKFGLRSDCKSSPTVCRFRVRRGGRSPPVLLPAGLGLVVGQSESGRQDAARLRCWAETISLPPGLPGLSSSSPLPSQHHRSITILWQCVLRKVIKKSKLTQWL